MPNLSRLGQLAEEMMIAHTDENGAGVSDDMRLEGAVLLCTIREKHLQLFLDSRIKADMGAQLKEQVKQKKKDEEAFQVFFFLFTPSFFSQATVDDALAAEYELQAFLKGRIASLLDFEFSEAAKKLLQLDEQEAKQV